MLTADTLLICQGTNRFMCRAYERLNSGETRQHLIFDDIESLVYVVFDVVWNFDPSRDGHRESKGGDAQVFWDQIRRTGDPAAGSKSMVVSFIDRRSMLECGHYEKEADLDLLDKLVVALVHHCALVFFDIDGTQTEDQAMQERFPEARTVYSSLLGRLGWVE